jgi:hypothetical protein
VFMDTIVLGLRNKIVRCSEHQHRILLSMEIFDHHLTQNVSACPVGADFLMLIFIKDNYRVT